MSLEALVRLRRGELSLDAELEVPKDLVTAVLGPNGAGKTTLLRALCGFHRLESGHIKLDGVALDAPASRTFQPPERRRVGIVYQDLLLFPHLNVLDNVAFGLHRLGRREARRRALGWLDRLGIGDLAGRRPRELSGGQAQRAALARALAAEPRLLLLDEPLSALDASARIEVRRELRRHLQEFSGVRLLVTHDPLEAAALADRVIVMEAGSISQVGSIGEITSRPRSRYAADLAGLNMWRGRAAGGGVAVAGASPSSPGTSPAVLVATAEPVTGEVFVVIHPRSVALHRRRPEGTPRNVWSGRVVNIESQGDRVRVLIEAGIPIVAEITPAALAELGLADRLKVWLSFKATEVVVYPV